MHGLFDKGVSDEGVDALLGMCLLYPGFAEGG